MFRAMLKVGAGRSIETRSGTESRVRGCWKARKAQNRESVRFVVPRRRRISRIRPALRDMYRIFLTQGGNVSFHMCLTQRARVSSHTRKTRKCFMVWPFAPLAAIYYQTCMQPAWPAETGAETQSLRTARSRYRRQYLNALEEGHSFPRA